MREETRALVVNAPLDTVDSVHDFLDAFWLDHPDVDAVDKMTFETALIELASNVIQHADSGNGVTCVLSITTAEDGLSAVLSDTADEGGVVLAPRVMPDGLAESGRGIALIQRLVDALDYERIDNRNVWTITKRRTPAR